MSLATIQLYSSADVFEGVEQLDRSARERTPARRERAIHISVAPEAPELATAKRDLGAPDNAPPAERHRAAAEVRACM